MQPDADAQVGNAYADGYAKGLEAGKAEGWAQGARDALSAAKQALRSRSPQVRLTYEGGVKRATKMIRKMLDSKEF